MRTARIKFTDQPAVYHCISRIVGGQRLLGPLEKEQFRKRMHRQAAFCGIQVLTYCLMSNHVHLLIRVPDKIQLTDRELLGRVKAFYGKDLPEEIKTAERKFRKTGKLPEGLCAKHLRRMGDLSIFMQELKQGFSRWYNKEHDRFGTLWAERFTSLVVENQPGPLSLAAAYVDLNPVRAGMVQDPKDYRFCGYAEAVAGSQVARAGIASFQPDPEWKKAGARYREQMFLRAGTAGQSGKQVLEEKTIRKVLKEGGELTQAQALRVRIRYLSQGVALGGEAFVEEVFRKFRDRFGPKRKTGARPLRRLPFKDLRTCRDLKKNVLG